MKKGHLLLIIIALLLICVVIVVSIIKLNGETEEKPSINTNRVDNTIKLVENINDYYTIQNCVTKFYKYYSLMYENIDEDNIEQLYNLLDTRYIAFKGLTKTNVKEMLPRAKSAVVNIDNIYLSVQNEDILIYIVDGILREEVSKELSNFQIMLKVDITNKTFSVLLQDYIEAKYRDLEEGSPLIFEELNNIEVNRNNQYVAEDVSEETYIIDLVNRFSEEALYNTEKAYERLDKEYESIKFGSIFKFKEYINEYKEEIANIEISKYQIKETDHYIQYTCLDKNGRYYILRETGIFEYTLILDTYTIDLPEFLEKYNVSNSVQRVGYNITKCIDAINSKDYRYVYDKLDFEFKAVNYVTIESFEEDIRNNLFNVNEIKAVVSYNEGSTYIYKLTITDVNDNTKEQDMTIVMQLKEGTDFVMSISFQ